MLLLAERPPVRRASSVAAAGPRPCHKVGKKILVVWRSRRSLSLQPLAGIVQNFLFAGVSELFQSFLHGKPRGFIDLRIVLADVPGLITQQIEVNAFEDARRRSALVSQRIPIGNVS